jgi:nucleoside-diphosphate-sugar epimerase
MSLKCLVTGTAGFIGSHLAERLIAEGCSVGGSRVSINYAIGLLEEILGGKAVVDYQEAQHGDVRHTLADTSAAREALGFVPKVGLEEGPRAQVAWQIAACE